jgi:hypothetical protein
MHGRGRAGQRKIQSPAGDTLHVLSLPSSTLTKLVYAGVERQPLLQRLCRPRSGPFHVLGRGPSPLCLSGRAPTLSCLSSLSLCLPFPVFLCSKLSLSRYTMLTSSFPLGRDTACALMLPFLLLSGHAVCLPKYFVNHEFNHRHSSRDGGCHPPA